MGKLKTATCPKCNKAISRHATELREHGHTICCRWINGSHLDAKDAAKYAIEDISDLASSDALIFFAKPWDTQSKRGGRHVEFGIALAMDKSIHVVGPRENVFHHLPQVAHWETFEQLLETL